MFENQLADCATIDVGSGPCFVRVLSQTHRSAARSVAVVVPAGRESDLVLVDLVNESVFVSDPT